MLAIAFELANANPASRDVASKFWEHFLYIANAMSSDGDRQWDEDDCLFMTSFTWTGFACRRRSDRWWA